MFKIKGNPLKVHSKVHFFQKMQKKYSIGFYTGGGNIKDWNTFTKSEKQNKLSKEWYVWWSFRNPGTNMLERQEPNIKFGINSHHNKKDRLKAMRTIKSELEDLLKTGYSPYDISGAQPEYTSIDAAFHKALQIKKSETKETTYKDYLSRINQFKIFLQKNGVVYIGEVNKKIVSTYLNSYQGKTSNNHKAAISAIFTVLSDQDYIKTNFVKEIRNKPVRKKSIRIYTEKEIEKITDLLEDQDKELLIFIQLISFNFWRPLELAKIEIKDIDLKSKRIQVDTKGKDRKTKIIPEIILKDLQEFIKGREGLLFDFKAKSPIDRRNAMTSRFRSFRKRNNISIEFKMYSFRHTFITKLYLVLRKEFNISDTIKELSLITGHESKAIFAYIQTNDIELPEDYSNLLK